MKSNGFNLFDQAFAVAEQKKTEKIEKSTRKTPIYLIVGLDFGTAFTKCMVRDRNYLHGSSGSPGRLFSQDTGSLRQAVEALHQREWLIPTLHTLTAR